MVPVLSVPSFDREIIRVGADRHVALRAVRCSVVDVEVQVELREGSCNRCVGGALTVPDFATPLRVIVPLAFLYRYLRQPSRQMSVPLMISSPPLSV